MSEFLHKIAHKLTGEEDHDQPATGEQKSDAHPHGGAAKNDPEWADKFRDILDGGASNRREAELERLRLEKERIEKEQQALQAEHEAHSFRSKIKNLFQDSEEEKAEQHRLELQAELKRLDAERAKLRESSWTHKVKAVFDDNDSEARELERQRIAAAAKDDHSFGARVRGFFGTDKEAPKTTEERKSMGDRILSFIEGPDEAPPEDRGWLGEKLNSLAGGGRKAETEEDKLDKLIDIYQKQVLKQGDQRSESAAEQAKDKLIAASVRKAWQSTTGKEFPIKEKK